MAVVRDPAVRGGIPVFKGTRLSPLDLLGAFAEGLSEEEFLEEYPTAKRSFIEETKEWVLKELRAYEEELLKKASNRHFRRRLILVKKCLEVLERAFRGEEVNREEYRTCIELVSEILQKRVAKRNKIEVR